MYINYSCHGLYIVTVASETFQKPLDRDARDALDARDAAPSIELGTEVRSRIGHLHLKAVEGLPHTDL